MTKHKVAVFAELVDGAAWATEVAGHDIALVREGDTVYAIEDWCSHGEIPLSDGDVDLAACEIECFLHGSRFNLKTGEPTCLPATEPVPVYSTTIEGADVFVEIPTEI
ncbi:MAG TPA: non-heme iron oxygenase ferredoxin subunit [Aeromicrobium sp.]|nr:non-heme iron oxygenase ferredoxin subunit [Aeromicrobium sp.]